MSNSTRTPIGAALKGERRVCVFRPLSLAAATIIGSLALVGCGSAANDVTENDAGTVKLSGASDSPRPGVAATANETITTHVVEIKQFKFVPASLTVKKGDRIVWKNFDVVPHTATEQDKEWDSGNLNQNDEWSLIAEKVGEGRYICAYHPVMKGKIVVIE